MKEIREVVLIIAGVLVCCHGGNTDDADASQRGYTR